MERRQDEIEAGNEAPRAARVRARIAWDDPDDGRRLWLDLTSRPEFVDALALAGFDVELAAEPVGGADETVGILPDAERA